MHHYIVARVLAAVLREYTAGYCWLYLCELWMYSIWLLLLLLPVLPTGQLLLLGAASLLAGVL